MNDIISMVALGSIAGMISGFFTRIIKRGMIFARIGAWLRGIDETHIINTQRHSKWVSFLQCIFCLTPWLVIILCTIYIIEYDPWWPWALIGIFGAFGSGNLVCEVIYCLREGE